MSCFLTLSSHQRDSYSKQKLFPESHILDSRVNWSFTLPLSCLKPLMPVCFGGSKQYVSGCSEPKLLCISISNSCQPSVVFPKIVYVCLCHEGKIIILLVQKVSIFEEQCVKCFMQYICSYKMKNYIRLSLMYL